MGKKRKAKESDREIDSEVEDDIVKKRNTRGVVGGRKKSFRELGKNIIIILLVLKIFYILNTMY